MARGRGRLSRLLVYWLLVAAPLVGKRGGFCLAVMAQLSQTRFLQTLPDVVIPQLPAHWGRVQVKQPWGFLVQFHFGEPNLHYEVVKAYRTGGYEVGLHFEDKRHELNRFLLDGFRRHLLEIKHTLGDSIEAEMWDRGWTKVYEVIPEESLTTDYQERVAARLVEMMNCFQPILVGLRAAA
ncbi:MAG: hypothetical protein V9G20_24810 [Candidatus Promineifilaceae bacterium]